MSKKDLPVVFHKTTICRFENNFITFTAPPKRSHKSKIKLNAQRGLFEEKRYLCLKEPKRNATAK